MSEPRDKTKRRPWYCFCQFIAWCLAAFMFRLRVQGRRNVPRTGGVLLISNHQSFMDPVLATVGLSREGNYMARDSLFHNKWFGRLIASLNAFPVARNSADVGAIKESLRRLKQGRLLVMFPEGTRTTDGHIGPLLPGLAAIAKKARVPIVPTLIDGVYQAWPRTQPLPSPGNVIVVYDRPIMPDEYRDLNPEELTALIRERLIATQQRLHAALPERRL